MIRYLLCALYGGTLLLPATAFAHPGADASSFVAGLVHPLGGMDHLVAMIAVGVLASQFKAALRTSLVSAFIVAMLIGAIVGAAGLALPNVEPMIALSLLMFGAAIALPRRASATLSLAGVVTFGFFHGHAHGTEMVGSSLLSFGLGFSFSAALLQGLGLYVTLRARELGEHAQTAIRVSGGMVAGIGIVLVC